MNVEKWDAIKDFYGEDLQMEKAWFDDLYEDPSQEIDKFLKNRIY